MKQELKKKTASLIEGVSESTAACLITMVQGNLLSLTLGHLLIASQTGVLAGVSTFILTLLAQVKIRWIVHLLLGLLTAVFDYYMHPGSFGGVATEAIFTGIAAGLMSYLVGTVIVWINNKRGCTQYNISSSSDK